MLISRDFMAKLIFIYGTMGSAKTTNALMKYFELKSQGKTALLLKPSIDTRDGEMIIKSRIGLSETAKVIHNSTNLERFLDEQNKKIDTIIIDEAQFCSAHHIDELKRIAIYKDIPVYVYGLKTNFVSNLFEGSKRLIELADELRTLEMTCAFCGKQAEINARFDKEENLITEGEVVDLGGNEKYKPLCFKCWNDLKNKK